MRIRFDDGFVIEGETEKAILDAWNALPDWGAFDPVEFRVRLIDLTGADVAPEQADEEILPAVVEAAPDARFEEA